MNGSRKCKPMRKLRMVRFCAGGFIAFLIAVVVIANRGGGNDWWPFLAAIPYGDKVGHVGLFGTLSLLCNLAFPCRLSSILPFFITKTTLALLIVISLEEISQIFIPSRSFDLIDWLADITGLTLGQLAASSIQRLLLHRFASTSSTDH